MMKSIVGLLCLLILSFEVYAQPVFKVSTKSAEEVAQLKKRNWSEVYEQARRGTFIIEVRYTPPVLHQLVHNTAGIKHDFSDLGIAGVGEVDLVRPDGSISKEGKLSFRKILRSNQNLSGGTAFHIGNGYLLTNRHIAEYAQSINVQSLVLSANGDRNSIPAELIWYSPLPMADLALVKISDQALETIQNQMQQLGEPLHTFEFAPLERLTQDPRAEVGFVGNPLGDESSFSQDNILNINRGQHGILQIQVDSYTASGNSGGPLFDKTAEILGITSTITTAMNLISSGRGHQTNGTGFAVATAPLLPLLLKQTKTTGDLEVSFSIPDVCSIWREMGNDPFISGSDQLVMDRNDDYSRVCSGAEIDHIVHDKSGKLQEKDIVVGINGHAVEIFEENSFLVVEHKNNRWRNLTLNLYLSLQAGSEVDLEIYRNGKFEHLTIKINDSEKELLRLQELQSFPNKGSQYVRAAGFVFQNVSKYTLAFSNWSTAGLEAGDVVLTDRDTNHFFTENDLRTENTTVAMAISQYEYKVVSFDGIKLVTDEESTAFEKFVAQVNEIQMQLDQRQAGAKVVQISLSPIKLSLISDLTGTIPERSIALEQGTESTTIVLESYSIETP